jgi:hypothetical protein
MIYKLLSVNTENAVPTGNLQQSRSRLIEHFFSQLISG